MHDLVQPVHAGIGTPGADGLDRRRGERRQRLFELVLDRQPVGLRLPAVVARAAIAHAQCQPRERGRYLLRQGC